MAKQYFPHDYYAREDDKMKKILRLYGVAGIGVYWCIIEMLYEAQGRLPLASIEDIAFSLHADSGLVSNIINSDLFSKSETHFFSESALSRIEHIKRKSQAAKHSIEHRWSKKTIENKEDNTNVLRSNYERNTNERENDTTVLRTENDRITTPQNTPEISQHNIETKENDQKTGNEKALINKEDNTNVLHPYYERNTIKLNEIKLNEIKEEENINIKLHCAVSAPKTSPTSFDQENKPPDKPQDQKDNAPKTKHQNSIHEVLEKARSRTAPEPMHKVIYKIFAVQYKKLAGVDYKATDATFSILSRFEKTYGAEVVLKKIKILHDHCIAKTYPCSLGVGDFTIEKLSYAWNSLVESNPNSEGEKSKDIQRQKQEKEKAEMDRIKTAREKDDEFDKKFNAMEDQQKESLRRQAINRIKQRHKGLSETAMRLHLMDIPMMLEIRDIIKEREQGGSNDFNA